MATNIECFDELVGRLFMDLYDSFPVQLPLLPETYLYFLMGLDPEYQTEAKFEDSAEAHVFYDATVSWLTQSGYISCSGATLNSPPFAVLTAKGLEALKAMPDSLAGESLGDGIKDAMKTGALEKLRELTGLAIGTGMKLGASYMGMPTV